MGKMQIYCPNCNLLFKSTEEMWEHYKKEHEAEDLALEAKIERHYKPKAVYRNKKEILVSDEMSDEEIKKRINEDMMNLKMHEAGTAWMRLGSLLSFNSTEQILGAGLKAIIDQNKIIIRQNELMLRALNKNKEKSQDKEPTKLA